VVSYLRISICFFTYYCLIVSDLKMNPIIFLLLGLLGFSSICLALSGPTNEVESDEMDLDERNWLRTILRRRNHLDNDALEKRK
jgi:hypothetical protein